MKYATIQVQGNIISEEVIQKIEVDSIEGQKPTDFGFETNVKLRNHIEFAWSRIKLAWANFYEKTQNIGANDSFGTSITRRWADQFFDELFYEIRLQKNQLQAENGKLYPISHCAENLNNLPIHIVGFTDPANPEKNTLDIKSSGGQTRLSPHALMQEYLNATEHLYGLICNGFSLRLIRDSGRLIKLIYIEFDLKKMMVEEKYSEFTLLYRLLHYSRFPKSFQDAEKCIFERYHKESIEAGNRIREGLSQAVLASLNALGTGFIQNEKNHNLRNKLKSGELSPKDYYRQLLRIIYRLLFLMVTEERDLIYETDKEGKSDRYRNIYRQFYSLMRLRKLSENTFIFDEHYEDVWQSLLTTFSFFDDSGRGKPLGISPLGGDLFDANTIPDLKVSAINNKLLLSCIRNLNEFRDESGMLVSINYRSLDIEELGSVYEGLLDLHPVINNIDSTQLSTIVFQFLEGTDRKTTGSYYTNPTLVNELIKSALIPVIESKLKQAKEKEAQIKALLSLKVCDPAAGSGHMLLAAARTIAWYLARVKSGEENPPPTVFRECVREAIQHCIYAVDYNPDAVELCKLALWLEGHNSGRPLSFLDHKIKNGNSLVGVFELNVLNHKIPDGAFEPIDGDDRSLCTKLKRINRNATEDFSGGLDFDSIIETSHHAKDFNQLETIDQHDLLQVKQVKQLFEKHLHNKKWLKDWLSCSIWTSAFFQFYNEEHYNEVITTEKFLKFVGSNSEDEFNQMITVAKDFAAHLKFFHWPIEFPDVFEGQGGFDVVLANPPWEKIKIQQKEFFATRDPQIAKASNADERNRLIEALPTTNPKLYQEFLKALQVSNATGRFLRFANRFQLTARGDINTYPIFAELGRTLINKNGRVGIIVPSGIATDDGNKEFFGDLVEKNCLVSLFDFENREALFAGVHRSYKFCLLTIAGGNIGSQKTNFAFFLTQTEQLQNPLRTFSLTREDFIRLNPNTKTCPIFRTKKDAEITTKIYNQVPILINEITNENPWGVKFQTMFHMSNDSHLFRTRSQLEKDGFQLFGNKMKKGIDLWLPLYEGKMIWHFDHRFATYLNTATRETCEETTEEQHQNPNYQILPWYWVKKSDVLAEIDCNWLIGFRDIARSTDERTAIFTVQPWAAIGNNNPLIFQKNGAIGGILFTSNLANLFFDYFTRIKIAGTHMNFFYVNQLPILPLERYSSNIKINISKLAIELIYTAWDLKPMMDELWHEADSDLKKAFEEQFAENKKITSGHQWSPPEWCEIKENGCPLPPFKWDGNRRALLRAELDAIFAKLYGLTSEELRYILDPSDIYGPDYPSETFRVLKDKEIRKFGEYRTRRLILEAWEKLPPKI